MHRGSAAGIAGWIATVAFTFPVLASPTAVGLNANNPSNANVLTDTSNKALLYVIPPTIGDLKVTKTELAVDSATCNAIASLNNTRLAQNKTIEEISNKILSLEKITRGLLDSFAANEITRKDFDEKYKLFSDLGDKERAKRENAIADTKLPDESFLKSAGYYSVLARANWDDAIKQIRGANPSLTVEHIPTADAEVFVSVVGANGFTPNELVAMVNTNNIKDVSSVVEGLQIDVEPTKIGACFINFPQIMGGGVKPFPFGVTINYTHQIAISTTVQAEYNLKDVYKYLETTGSSSNLFSSKSWSEVTESHDVDELFKIKITFEHDATNEEKDIEQKRVREYLLGVAVADMTAKVVPAGNPGKTGAQIASETLVKTCGANAYCAGAAAGLTILNGIFGHSGSSSSLVKTLDVHRMYDSAVTKTIKIPGTISFATHD